MHNRKKVLQPDSEKLEKQAKKAAKLLALQNQVIEFRNKHVLNKEALELTTLLLEHMCDFLTAWNYRREILLHLISIDETQQDKLFDEELEFTQKCVPNCPKSYYLWHHRRWILERVSEVHLKNELTLCARMLAADSRNFHCWRHRMWVSNKIHEISDSTLEVATTKLNEDPSNYSAWHLRSRILTLKAKEGAATATAVSTAGVSLSLQDLQTEFELTHQATFTEPEDQSAWFYYHWLIGTIPTTMTNEVAHVIRNELETCGELLSLDQNLKWPTLAKVNLIRMLGQCATTEETCQLVALLQSLKTIDPMRRHYYTHLESLVPAGSAHA